jgi:hypothetical protein
MKDVLEKLRVAIKALEPVESPRCRCVTSPVKSVTTHCGGHGIAPDEDLTWVYHTLVSIERDLERLSDGV